MSDPQNIGRYQLRNLLGQGGMARVLLAWDPVLDRQVAIKVVQKAQLEAGTAELVLSRFRREAQAAARLSHPNIVQVYEFGEDERLAFIAMELVAGRPLTHFLREGVPMELPRVLLILTQLLEALSYSHERGVVHRDIKPGNLLIVPKGTVVKITDFGIARIESSVLTQHGDLLGTPSYMAPEQYLGERADGRADLFSAGVLLYELVTGVRPFGGESNAQVMNRILYDNPPPPSQVNAALPPGLDWVINRALAKEPEDRFPTAAAFLEALDAAVTEQGANGAGPPPVPQAPPPGAQPATVPGNNEAMLGAARRLRQSLVRGGTGGTLSTLDFTTGAGTAPGPATNPTVGRARILFVDDEERILNALKTVFRGKYHVLTALNGREALDFVRRFRIPVICSDQRMPGMTGVELLRQSREISPDSVRLLLTGYSDLASIAGSINEGEVHRFISKPWDNQELQRVISEAVALGEQSLAAGSGGASAPVAVERPPAAIVVLDAGRYIYQALARGTGAGCEVLHAESISRALEVLAVREVAALVVDIDGDSHNCLLFMNLLKRRYPEILVIVLTGASDSELMIQLINQAQVFRFVNKPVNLGVLGQHLDAAVARYAQFRANPDLARRATVDEAPDGRDSGFAQSLREGLRSLRGWLRPGRPEA